ncbi:MAG: DUF1292 domain-containing protein [Lachnospiraceae bacterium]|jgi:uncharacterized protein YrzB (UPF0473 family)
MAEKHSGNQRAEEYDDRDTITLNLDSGEDVECIVVTSYEAGGKNYIALLPTEGLDAEEGEVYLYRYHDGPDGDPVLEYIESDEEYDIASDAFDEWLDSQEYDELVGDEEAEDGGAD